MPAKSYYALIAGRMQEVFAAVTGGTVAQAGSIVALDDSGRLDQSILPVGIGQDVYTGTAAGALTAGDFVVRNSTGIARASAASGGDQADGFVLSSSTNGAAATMYNEGTNTSLTALTVGARYYLSDSTPGGVTVSPVSGTGKIHQYLGKAITATSIAFEGDDGIIRA